MPEVFPQQPRQERVLRELWASEALLMGKCARCSGTGEAQVRCDRCDGSGKVIISGNIRERCYTCGGNKTVRGRCPSCNGSGEK